ncbi:hypothetical protein EW146_g1621 [Bondarzewia mesenterica]|uniref:Alpha-type protein kinase domain-containing protein n=1 Tax=Bondarzewia mesenterica TaxID=1095465 RepID=A0A4S4M350_9AGAM|nr:hypothetical protein EW146_g1621 [Bondarzewia mesenterica]
MADSEAQQASSQSTDTECGDCGQNFPGRESRGLCLKCLKLRGLDRTSEEYKMILGWPQCDICGMTRPNLPLATEGIQTCKSARCLNQVNQKDPLASASSAPHQPATPDIPLIARPPIPETLKLQHPQMNANGALTSEALLQLERGGGISGEQQLTVAWQVRLSSSPKTIHAALGNNAQKWATSVYLTDIKASIVKHINIEWTRDHDIPLVEYGFCLFHTYCVVIDVLSSDEVTFRFPDNKTLMPDTSTMTLGQFFSYYSHPSRQQIYLANVPTVWKKLDKKRLVCFEMYVSISLVHWKKRTDPDQTEVQGSTDFIESTLGHMSRMGRKRKRITNNEGESELPRIQHARIASSSMTSHFSGLITSVDGTTNFEDHQVDVKGYIRDALFAQGKMKSVFEFTPSSSVGAWFLAEFFKHAREIGVDVATNIEFAEAWLGQEKGVAPSVASGTASNEVEEWTWLVEKRRPESITRLSGTLVHPSSHRGRLNRTILAFAHFVYVHSHQTMVLADIQGTHCQIRGGIDGFVLFDPMTHTIDGWDISLLSVISERTHNDLLSRNSGVGDHGTEGINTFLRDHRCNKFCHDLGLGENGPSSVSSQTKEHDEDDLQEGRESGLEESEDLDLEK